MLDNLTYGPHGYSTHEESFAQENEYHSNSGNLQMMPPRVDSPHYSKQHMLYPTGNQGSYDGWNGKPNKYPNGAYGWYGGNMPQGGWSSSPNGYYNYIPGGQLPGMHGPARHHGYGHGHAPGHMSNMMGSSEYETSYHAGPGQMRTQNYGMHSESYDDYANGLHNDRQKVEWKAL